MPTGPSLDGKLLEPGDAAYEGASAAAVWNGRKPPRRPAAILLAEDADDVAAGVRLAVERDLKVSVRSGGHSWVAAGVREGALLIDLSRLDAIEVDAARRRAVVGPGAFGGDLNEALAPHGLFFPVGHCPTVALGGFLMVGGMGWNWRGWGPGCSLVEAIDVVTAEGELIRADAEQNADYFWAARGSGPGFFGIVTAFHLSVRQAPTLVGCAHNYPLASTVELLTWLHEMRDEVPPIVDQVVYGTQHVTDAGEEPTLLLSAMAFGESAAEARDALKVFDDCPVADQAHWLRREVPFTIADLPGLPSGLYQAGLRYCVDSAYFAGASTDYVEPLAQVFAGLPTRRSHVMWMDAANSAGPETDMCFSLRGDALVEIYAVWDDPAEDAAMEGWTAGEARRLEPWASGCYMGADNMVGGAPPGAYLSEDSAARLERLRQAHDPSGRFESFLLPG